MELSQEPSAQPYHVWRSVGLRSTTISDQQTQSQCFWTLVQELIFLTTLVVNFMDIFNYARDSQRLQVSDKGQFSAIGQYLEELRLIYPLGDGIVHDWTFNMLLHAPNLRMLYLKSQDLSGRTELIHHLASAGPLWSQLLELRLKSIPASIEDLMVLLQRCRHSLRGFKIRVMRMYANVKDSSTSFPALQTVSFDSFTLAVAQRDSFIYFPVVIKDPFVDELQGTKLEFAMNNVHGWPRVLSRGLLRSEDRCCFGYTCKDSSGWLAYHT